MVSVTQRNIYSTGQFSDSKGQQLWAAVEEVILNISTEVLTVGNYQTADFGFSQNGITTPYTMGSTSNFRHFASIYFQIGSIIGLTTMCQVTNIGIAHTNLLDAFFTVQTAFAGTLINAFLRVTSPVTLTH